MKKNMRTFFVTLAALCVCCCTVSLLTACDDDDEVKVGTLHVDINPKEVYKQMDYMEETILNFDFQPGNHYFFIYAFEGVDGQHWAYGTGKIL